MKQVCSLYDSFSFNERTYLLKPGISQKDPKTAETTQNQSKRPKKLQNDRSDPKFQNWGNLKFSTSFRSANFEPKCPNLGILGRKVLII